MFIFSSQNSIVHISFDPFLLDVFSHLWVRRASDRISFYGVIHLWRELRAKNTNYNPAPVIQDFVQVIKMLSVSTGYAKYWTAPGLSPLKPRLWPGKTQREKKKNQKLTEPFQWVDDAIDHLSDAGIRCVCLKLFERLHVAGQTMLGSFFYPLKKRWISRILLPRPSIIEKAKKTTFT